MEHTPPKKVTKALWERTKKLIFSVSLFASFLLITFSGLLLKKNLDEHIQFLGRSLTQALKYHISSGEVYVLSEMAHEFETQKWCEKIIVTDNHFKVIHSKMSSGLPDEFYMTKINPDNYEYRFPIQSEGMTLGYVLINKNNMQFWLPFTLSCLMIFGSMIILYLIFIRLSLNKVLKNAEVELTSIYQKSEQKLWKAVQEKELEQNRKEAISLLSSQVAHDIRSPLAALNVISKDLSELPEEKRLLLRAAVQRIDDIANDLSSKKHVGTTQQGEYKDSPLQDDGDFAQTQDTRDVYLLSGIIEPLISEKRLQHRSKINVEICSDLGESSYGLFAKVNLKEFKRVLSNLINNAVEVFDPLISSGQGIAGQVTVSLRVGAGSKPAHVVGAIHELPLPNDMIQIQIKDNGKGIPSEILSKLTQRGNTFGKEGGSGLGLYHARTTVEKWGGDLKIESIHVGADRCVGPDIHGQSQGIAPTIRQTHRSAPTGSGTVVTILLKKEPAPDWFVAELKLQDKMTVVIVDDDNSIHQVWNGRLRTYIKDKTIHIAHFSNPDTLREWYEIIRYQRNWIPGQARDDKKIFFNESLNPLFLCDYEFLGHKQTGLDIIEELGIAKQSILVTSRYEEEPVRERCARLGIKLIPKPLAGFVPISLDRHVPQCGTRNDVSLSLLDPGSTSRYAEGAPHRVQDDKEIGTHRDVPDKIILLDDEKMIHTTWRISGKQRAIVVKPYLEPSELIKELHLYPKDTEIYIDSNLSHGQKGEDVAKRFYEMGFRNIYLTTGTSPKLFPKMPWIKKVIGKTPPWVEE